MALAAGPTPEPALPEPSSKPTGNIAEDAVCAKVGAALCVTPFSAMGQICAARSAAIELAPVTAGVLAGTWTRLHLWYARNATTGHPQPLAAAAVAAACAQPRVLIGGLRPGWGGASPPNSSAWTPQAVADRIKARRRERGARLDPEPDLRGRISVDGSWETMAWAFRQFRRWAETERDRLRHIRKHDPSARFCCPQAMARLLTHATTDTDGDRQ
ncbi:MAG: hypothetical protein V9E94_01455 [Microthrixaceae bacterium]